MKITKNGQGADMAQSIDTYVTQSIAAVDASITQSIEKFDASTTESDALDTYVIQSIIDLDTYVTQFIATWWSLIQDTEQNEEANERESLRHMCIPTQLQGRGVWGRLRLHEDATLEEDEREAAATLRILCGDTSQGSQSLRACFAFPHTPLPWSGLDFFMEIGWIPLQLQWRGVWGNEVSPQGIMKR